MPSSVLNSMSLRMATFSSHIRLWCTVASMSRRREPPFDGSVANDRNELAPPHRSSLRSRRHSNTSPNGRGLCVTAKLHGHVRVGSKTVVTRLKCDVRFSPETDVYRTLSQGGLFGLAAGNFAYEPGPPV